MKKPIVVVLTSWMLLYTNNDIVSESNAYHCETGTCSFQYSPHSSKIDSITPLFGSKFYTNAFSFQSCSKKYHNICISSIKSENRLINNKKGGEMAEMFQASTKIRHVFSLPRTQTIKMTILGAKKRENDDDTTIDEESRPNYKSKLYTEMLKDYKGKKLLKLTNKKDEKENGSELVSEAAIQPAPKSGNRLRTIYDKREKATIKLKKEKYPSVKKNQMKASQFSDPEINDESRDMREEEIDKFLFGSSEDDSSPFLFWDNQTVSSFSQDVSSYPNEEPREILDRALRSLRNLDHPTPNHGAAEFLKYCLPISKSDQWGAMSGTATKNDDNEWSEIIRGSLTSAMLVGRLLASPNFSILLEWDRLDVTDGYSVESASYSFGSTVAFVSAAMFVSSSVNGEQEVKNFNSNTFNTIQPVMVQFTLRKQLGGTWLIDKAVINKREWFES